MVSSVSFEALLFVCSLLLGASYSQYYFTDYEGATYYLYHNVSANATNDLIVSNRSDLATLPNSTLIQRTMIINNESVMDVGWDFVYVAPDARLLANSSTVMLAYYYAGYAEGYVTYNGISQTYNLNGNYSVDPAEMTWVQDHINFMSDEVAANSAIVNQSLQDPFWTQVGCQLQQIQGMADGFSRAARDRHVAQFNDIQFLDMFLISFSPEMYDVGMATGPNATVSGRQHRRRSNVWGRNSHCSALVAVTSEDLYLSHDTWSNYNLTAGRQFKVYEFQTTVSQSGYPGSIVSGDDWYMTSNNLAVTETTTEFSSVQLAKDFVVPQTVSEFLRVMAANFLAVDGPSWVSTFSRYNSGTYCNQWMVVNYKLYTAGSTGSSLPSGLLWVAEQIPGNVTSADLTVYLQNFSYWASYNIPYFPNIFVASGFQDDEDEFGSFFSWNNTARANIFRTYINTTSDLPSVMQLMRYNDWQNSSLSMIPNCTFPNGTDACNPRNSPLLAIASRGDLVPTTPTTTLPADYNYSQYFEFGFFGAIDSKVTSSTLFANMMQAVVISGPTSSQQKVFNWTAFGVAPPDRCPAVLDFPWVFFNVPTPPPPPKHWYGGVANTHAVIIAVCASTAIGIVILAVVIKLRTRSKSPENYQSL